MSEKFRGDFLTHTVGLTRDCTVNEDATACSLEKVNFKVETAVSIEPHL